MKRKILTLCFTAVFSIAVAQQNANYVTAEDLRQLLSKIDGSLSRIENLSANPDTPEPATFEDMTIEGTAYHIGTSGAIDLGLTVKWAAYNVGAVGTYLLIRSGDYFAWGENVGHNDGKSQFDWSSYFYTPNHDGESFIKYKNSAKTRLDLSDDVAHAKMEGRWRMPTKDEMDDLVDKCTWKWTKLAGVFGYLVVGNTGNSIFLPAAGGYEESTHIVNQKGFYWTSSLDTLDDSTANALYFESGSKSVEKEYRCIGFSVRPVYCSTSN